MFSLYRPWCKVPCTHMLQNIIISSSLNFCFLVQGKPSTLNPMCAVLVLSALSWGTTAGLSCENMLLFGIQLTIIYACQHIWQLSFWYFFCHTGKGWYGKCKSWSPFQQCHCKFHYHFSFQFMYIISSLNSVQFQLTFLNAMCVDQVNQYLEDYERALRGFEAASIRDPGLHADHEVNKLVNLLGKLEDLIVNKVCIYCKIPVFVFSISCSSMVELFLVSRAFFFEYFDLYLSAC